MTSILLAAMLMRPALGGVEPQPAPDLSLMFLPSVQFEAPGRLTGGLSIFIPTRDDPGSGRDGWIVEARGGTAGGRVAFGRAGYLEYLGLDARLFLARTWGEPLNASTDSTYAGIEGGLAIAYVRVAAGVAQRLAGPAGKHRTVLTWSAGVQVPLFRR